MSVDRKAELAAIVLFVQRMNEATKRASQLELRHRAIEKARDLRPDRRDFMMKASRLPASRPAAPATTQPPRVAERARPFPKVGRWATADWYELLLPPRGLVKVPDGCLVTGGDRAWRRAEVPW
jgi:hypothetical protein